jgi:hypothetical protein
MMSDQQTESALFQYSIKIERSAKGARWTVHVHATTKEQALEESVRLYDDVGKKLEEQGLTVAPVEKGRAE